MNKILSKLLSVLKYLLLLFAFALTLFGIINTYKRLEKPILDAIPVFIPFALVLILFVISIFVKKAKMGENLLFNFTAVIMFIVIIIIGIRAKFDTNMMLYYKYKIDYNPLFFADNLSSIKIMLYCLSISNLFFLLKSIFNDNNVVKSDPKIEDKQPEPQKIVEPIQIIEQNNEHKQAEPVEEL